MKISPQRITAHIQKIAFAQHLVEGWNYGHGSYTTDEVTLYWRIWEDTGWEIACIPRAPKQLSDMLDREERIFADLKVITDSHVCTPDENKQCKVCYKNCQ